MLMANMQQHVRELTWRHAKQLSKGSACQMQSVSSMQHMRWAKHATTHKASMRQHANNGLIPIWAALK